MIDVRQVLLDAHWTAFEARAGFTDVVGPGGRIKTATDFWMVDDEESANDGKYPRVRVRALGRALLKPVVTFCPTVIKGVPLRIDVEIVATFAAQKDELVNPLLAEIDAALLAQGDQFGIPWVSWFTSAAPTDIRPSGGKRRIVATVRNTFECLPDNIDLYTPDE